MIRERESLTEISAYEPVEQAGLNLSDNANLFEPNPAIQQALESLDADTVRSYPTGYGDALRERIADKHGVDPNGVVIANGSSDLIDLLIRTFTDPGSRVAYHPPSFSMIPLWARCNAAELAPVPLGSRFALDADAFANESARIGFLCRPNNPTGNAFPLATVDRVLAGFEGLLVVDEAYASFLDDETAEDLILDRDDAVLLRSLSKDHGLAGIRFGYGLMDPSLAQQVNKTRGPFRVPVPTEAIAHQALEDSTHLDEVIDTVRTERARVYDRVDRLGLEPFPTQTNFLLIETPWPSETMADALAEQGILVRPFSSDALEACIRVTIGPPDTNDAFLEALETLLDGGGP